jgi:magnesium transporter
VLRSVSYSAAGDDLAFGEVHVFVGQGFVVTVRHAETPHLSQVRARLEARPEVLCKGPEAVVCAIFDEVVDGYGPVAARLQEQIDTIEDDVFDGVVDPNSSRRIYRLLSEVIGFQRAVEPVPGMLEALLKGADKYDTDEDTRNNLRNVLDHALRVTERIHTFRVLLENALTLHATLVTQEQNAAMRDLAAASLREGEESRRLAQATMEQGEQVKKISSWAAILFAPTLVASIYGMNFRVMPELHWAWGYPFAIGLMVAFSLVLWGVFKARHWL